MNTTKHTPGPWKVGLLVDEQMPYEIFTSKEGGQRIAIITAKHYKDNAEANATLCASAPTLLETCKAVIAALSQNKTFPADINAAKKWLNDAIAQAEGK